MSLDAATLALLAKELCTQLQNAKIDKIFEPTRDEIVFNLRKSAPGTSGANPKLFLSARSGAARACITKEVFENPAIPPSFCMLLRKHYTGGRLIDVVPVQDERIVFFNFRCTSELGDIVENTIAAELMGRYSNIVLIREGKIIDALKRVDFEDSNIRQLLPGLAYTMPPKPNKLSFLHTDKNEILCELKKRDTPIQDALMKIAGGVGPVICREVAHIAFCSKDVIASDMDKGQETAFLSALDKVRDYYFTSPCPSIVKDEDGAPVEFSFLPLTQYGDKSEIISFDSFSDMLEEYYVSKDKSERLRQKSRDLAKTVKNAYDRAIRKQAARKDELLSSGQSDELRLFGELLSANLWAFERGDKSVTLNNYYDGTDVTIPLNVRLTPSENAQKYFKEYKKKQTAAKMLVELLSRGETEIEYLKTVLYEIDTAHKEAALNEIRAELKTQGYLKYYKPKNKHEKPSDFIRYRSTDGFLILVGRNNMQNDMLTLKTARGRDWWFHVKNAPGSHVVIITDGAQVPDSTKTQAAQIAALHSSLGSGAKVDVDFTQVRNVKKTGDCKPGMVLYDPYETAVVTAEPEELEKLLQK